MGIGAATQNRSTDLLCFQILNWSGGLVLFSSFAQTQDPSTFAAIGRAETLLGCVGIFLFSTSLRLHGQGVSRFVEGRLLCVRVAVITAGLAGCLLGLWESVYFFALLAIVAVPTHLPLLQGYTSVVYSLLLLRFAAAGSAFWIADYQLSVGALAAVYFVPTAAYGIGSYLYYWRRLPSLPESSGKVAANGTIQFGIGALISFGVTVLCFAVQAQFVSHLIKTNWQLASIERLFRSSYSFAYPYSIRFGLWKRWTTIACASIVILFVAIRMVLPSPPPIPFLITGPLVLDAYASALAGRHIVLDVVFSLMLLKILET